MVGLLRMCSLLTACICVGTVFSQAIVLAYLANAWHVNGARLSRAVAALRGEETVESGTPPETAGGSHQPSYEEILERRALAVRNLELREHTLKEVRDQLQFDQRKLADENDRYRRLRESFEAELAALQTNSQSAGRDEVRRTLESIKPKQAREQILQMLQRDELDEVVALLGGMPDAKRARIIAEFKGDGDAQKLAEILRRIRDSAPAATVVENAQSKLP